MCGAILQNYVESQFNPWSGKRKLERRSGSDGGRGKRESLQRLPSFTAEAPEVRKTHRRRCAVVPAYHPRIPSVLHVFHRQSIGFLSARGRRKRGQQLGRALLCADLEREEGGRTEQSSRLAVGPDRVGRLVVHARQGRVCFGAQGQLALASYPSLCCNS